MSNLQKRRVFLWLAVPFGFVLVALSLTAYILAHRFEPFVREQTAAYLRRRFNSELTWNGFHVQMPLHAPLRVLFQGGRGVIVSAEADGIALRYQGRTDIPPLLTMRKLQFQVEMKEVLARPVPVKLVRIEGLELNIPPAGNRPRISPAGPKAQPGSANSAARQGGPSVKIEQIVADGTRLMILPRGLQKPPLKFDIYRLRLDAAGPGVAMPYHAVLHNALPPGLINSDGTFGPWDAESPGDTPLTGDYTFRNADLSVFKSIAGMLSSTGNFRGELDEITVDGETVTPDFRLRASGNPILLRTNFHALVDGTNGNTWLQPVEGTLNRSHFTAQGEVVRNPGDPGRTISLDVTMKAGRVEDFLRLALKGPKAPFEGAMNLRMKFLLPPGTGEIADRLRLVGNFKLSAAQFASPDIQEKIDELSRRGQGHPKQVEIADVASDFVGKFDLNKGVISLRRLQFAVPGAEVLVDGRYTFKDEGLDFHGVLRLRAKVSQTMTGVKRILLKPLDPFLAKEGAGTLLHIKIVGTRDNPEFGRDR